VAHDKSTVGAALWSRTAARWHAQPRLVQGRQRVRSLCGCGWWHSLSGITRRGGNNDRLSSLWREVISLAGAAMSFSSSGSTPTGATMKIQVRSRSCARHLGHVRRFGRSCRPVDVHFN
jgi:hypothetical protein